MNTKPTNRQIAGLDLLRFAAAMMVVLYHYCYATMTDLDMPAAVRGGAVAYSPAKYGALGVQIFFLISGFVIAYSAHGATPVRFARSRLLRIYPTVWICATLSLAMLAVEGALAVSPLRGYVRSMLLVPGDGSKFVDVSYWTLPIELAFYTLTFFLLWRRWMRHFDLAMVGLAIYSTVLQAAWIHHVGWVGRQINQLETHQALWAEQILLIQHGAFFAVGALLWSLLLNRATALRLAGIAIGVVGCIEDILHWFHPQAVAIWLGMASCLVLSVVLNDRVAAVLGERGRKLARSLGLLTYPLYLLHRKPGMILLGRLQAHVGFAVALVVTTGVFLGVAWVVAFHLEPAFRKRLELPLVAKEVPAASVP